jgi:hypothetical protein
MKQRRSTGISKQIFSGLFTPLSQTWLVIGGWCLLLAVGCSPASEKPTQQGAKCCSSLRFIHVDTSVGGVDLLADYYREQQILATNLAYGGKFPASHALQLKSTDPLDEQQSNAFTLKLRLNADTTDTLLRPLARVLTLKLDQRHSLWLADTGVRSLLFLQDDPLPRIADTNQAALRFVNVSRFANLRLSVFDFDRIIESSRTPKGQASPYFLSPKGRRELNVLDANDRLFFRLENIDLESGKSYTCYYDGNRLQLYEDK